MNYEKLLNKQEKRYVMVRSIYRLVIMFLGLVAWVLLLILNWKIATLLFFIIWGQNEAKK